MEDRGYRKQLEQSLAIEPQIWPSRDSWLGSPTEDKKRRSSSCRHGWPASRSQGCLRRLPC